MNEQQLERYAFLWSEVRLCLAAVALFLGGIPLTQKVALSVPGIYSMTGNLLVLSWILSGIVSAYLVYLWWKKGQMLFGSKKWEDKAAFFVNIVSGFNLGFAGLTGQNIGMTISTNYVLFIVVGVLYLIAAFYLYKRWGESNKSLF